MIPPGVRYLFRSSIQHDSEELLKLERRRLYAAGRSDAQGVELGYFERRYVQMLARDPFEPRRAYWLGVLREAITRPSQPTVIAFDPWSVKV